MGNRSGLIVDHRTPESDSLAEVD
ncbi:Lrp/AsnC family transcriptional regulator, partial [Burkholderia multivorans]